jgi:alpha-D-xyloside xylohydrolase
MKFTDGFWLLRPGVTATYAAEAYEVDATDSSLTAFAPGKPVNDRAASLNLGGLTIAVDSPYEGIARVRVTHHAGAAQPRGFEFPGETGENATTASGPGWASLTSGDLDVKVATRAPFSVELLWKGRRLTGLGHKSLAHMALADDAPVSAEPAGVAGYAESGLAPHAAYMVGQLDLGVGETIYGLGERFGPFVKNGQSVDIWNADGGTSSEQSYKSVPFYLSSAGYGVLVNHTSHVSFEVGTEAVERVQFSVPGEALEFLIVGGDDLKDVLDRYTGLTGRPARVPAWSYGLWLSTSFTTDYDEATLMSFVDGMAERDLPLSVVHFDCFWMREFTWFSGQWDERVFPDPEGLLARLHERGLKVSVWTNPYIAQRSPLFGEAVREGYLVRRADGSIFQWDWWQGGMGLVDFTNSAATAWFKGVIGSLLRQGVDSIKADFGERIPTDVVWHDGSDPYEMHNLYAQLYNRAVFEAIVEERGEGEAILFSRSATAGGQRYPLHWGGDNTSSFASMAESLRGGLSLASCGFGFWSHDIGGFEGTPDAGVFKRWLAFGLLSSHSRLHGSTSYRVPWAFDDEAVEITRYFARLKYRLMPYLLSAADEAVRRGTPVLRPMVLEFPDDLACRYLDRQYMLGGSLLVAPVMSPSGEVSFYLPDGVWTSLLTGERVEGGRWVRETHGAGSLPVYVRPGTVLARGTRDDRPDYDFVGEVELVVYPGGPDAREVTVYSASGEPTTFSVTVDGDSATASGPHGEVPARLA